MSWCSRRTEVARLEGEHGAGKTALCELISISMSRLPAVWLSQMGSLRQCLEYS